VVFDRDGNYLSSWGAGLFAFPHTIRADAGDRLWRCFIAERDGERVRVCERIVDAHDQDFTDASSWFWAATLGRSTGPWRAMTRVEAL